MADQPAVPPLASGALSNASSADEGAPERRPKHTITGPGAMFVSFGDGSEPIPIEHTLVPFVDRLCGNEMEQAPKGQAYARTVYTEKSVRYTNRGIPDEYVAALKKLLEPG